MVKKTISPMTALLLIAASSLTANESSAPAPVSAPLAAPPASTPQVAISPGPTKGEIEWLEQRGREIADYDHAAWVASDLLKPMKPDKKDLGQFHAIKYSGHWFVYFGRMSEDSSEFLGAYIFSCPEGNFEEMKLTPHPESWPKDDLYPFALALDVARGALREDLDLPPYNNYVFREPNGTITVYYLPGSTDEKNIRYGSDFKLSISADGRRVLQKNKLHNSMLTIPLGEAKKNGIKPAFNIHSHVVTLLPTETDVAWAIIFPKFVPHYVISKEYLFALTADGKLHYLGKPEQLFKSTSTPASAPSSTPTPKE